MTEQIEDLRSRVTGELPWQDPLFTLTDLLRNYPGKVASLQTWLRRGIVTTKHKPKGTGVSRLYSLAEVGWIHTIEYLSQRGLDPREISQAAYSIALLLLQAPLIGSRYWVVICPGKHDVMGCGSDKTSLAELKATQLPSGPLGGIFTAVDLRQLHAEVLPAILAVADVKVAEWRAKSVRKAEPKT